MIVRRPYDLVNTNIGILQVYDKPYHTNKRKGQKGHEIEMLQNCAL